ncbi:LuxR family transcriptional regulator [bacterium]|nr:LuxR family transcriptional regulator [bacterium]
MPTSILATKLYIPLPRPDLVTRPRLLTRMDESLHRKVTLVSAPAGFGKTTLVSAWIDNLRFSIDDLQLPTRQVSAIANRKSKIVNQIAWLSLDAGENDPLGFLTYLVAALQRIAPDWGAPVMKMLQSPQPPAPQTILTALLNEISDIPHEFVPQEFILVLDDYHVIEAKDVDEILTFLIEYLPPQMHLIITTREDPPIPLAKMRARGQLTEIRAADLRFSADEAADFLRRATHIDFSAEQVAAVDARTEGWIAGLQLAALSMQGHHHDSADFIASFTGSHRFVMDYLLEEVLNQQPEHVQNFLLRTSILDRMCAPLCETVVGEAASGGETLGYLERANLFLIALDNERRWYRYHHLFAELLRQRLVQQLAGHPDEENTVRRLHQRASHWYADNDLELEAFHHATAAQDVARAIDLIEAKGMPLQFRGGAVIVLNWIKSLPEEVLNAYPVLWITWGSALLMHGQVVGVEEKAAAAEAALAQAKMSERSRDLIGRIASLRATVAVTRHEADTIIVQAQRALTYLHPDNLPVRASINWALGHAHNLQGDRATAAQAYVKALAACKAVGHTTIAMMSAIGLGMLQEWENNLHEAESTFKEAAILMGEAVTPPVCDAHLGLARLYYQWNDLEAAKTRAEQSLDLARQIETTDRAVNCEIVLAQLKGAQGDLNGALTLLAEAEQVARRQHFTRLLPQIISLQVICLLRQGKVKAAAQLADAGPLPVSQASVRLAQGDASAALALLDAERQRVEAKQWAYERLHVITLQALAHQADGNKAAAVQTLAQALALAEPEGFVRLFLDEGRPMQQLLAEVQMRGLHPAYTTKLLAAFETEAAPAALSIPTPQPLIDPLSQRELEILALIATGLKNQEIADRLIISLNTVLYHTKNIYGKLGVNKRAVAINRARELELI